MNALVTGSHAYGTPSPASDIDLVVTVSPTDWILLQKAVVQSEQDFDPKHPDYSNPLSLRFGKLNLLITTDEGWAGVWHEGTEKLKKIAPVSRDVAVAVFRELRAKHKATLEELANPFNEVLA